LVNTTQSLQREIIVDKLSALLSMMSIASDANILVKKQVPRSNGRKSRIEPKGRKKKKN
jgi:hypothetical protein